MTDHTRSTTPVHGYGPTAVGVTLSACAAQDAATVFAVLCAAYETDRGPDDRPAEDATVWLTTVDVTPDARRPAPALLTAPVTADLQGGHDALDHLRATLDAAFEVTETSATPGDQEQAVELRLTGRG
ncbi:hypothetical protein ACIBL6_37280 [Streptomyces sp. NPDC050400]|uniref:hypothetical protein n=1 Tax=Streptomyces sp. NPDC050400 TaxID=3365610 RepID=UPI0037BA21FF